MKILSGSNFTVNLTLPKGTKELVMLWVSAGSFIMGEEKADPRFDLEYQAPFQASFSKGFWLGKYPVTQAQWLAIMGENPSQFQYDLDCPVENINWYDAMEYCNRVEQIFTENLPAGYHFSFPTEAQWEYACRAGTESAYYSGNSISNLNRVAWYKENSGGKTHPVGEKEPNAWGFYDMHGNVGEWCFDAVDDYPNQPSMDWVGRRDEAGRIIRGGSWGSPYSGDALKSATRGYPEAETKRPWFGFRLCVRAT